MFVAKVVQLGLGLTDTFVLVSVNNQKQAESFITRATVDAATVVETATDKTFEVIFATENPIFRRGWEENFNEILSCKPENIRSARLSSGAVPLLDNHDRYSGVSKQMGAVIEFKIEKGECRAKILFSTRAEFGGIWDDIKAGIIRSVSTGYNVYKYLREVRTDLAVPNYTAADWEPMEISLAPVPADFKSKVRSDDTEAHDIIIEDFSPVQNKRSDMSEIKTEVVEQTKETTQIPAQSSGNAQPQTVAVDTTAVRNEGIQAERLRVTEIQTAVRSAGLEDSVASDLITRGIDVNAARAEIINKIAEKNGGVNVRAASVAAIPTIVVDEVENTRNAMSDALMSRSQPGSVKLEGKAHDFKHMSMLDMARNCLIMAGDKKAMQYGPSEVIKRAISTTDYPNLLNSTVERSIRRQYEALPAEWKMLSSQTSAKDFREKTGIAVDGKVTFEEIAEGGEYKHSLLLVDDSAKIKLKTYGRMIKITRQAIINDDLDVFSKLPRYLAQGANNFQADKVWGLIINNAKTPDGKALFHADHGNIGVAGAITEASLAAARVAMYRHKTPAGELMPIEPKILLVPMELMVTAEKLMSSVLAGADNAVNTMAGKFKIMSNPRLINATAWYMVADPKTHEGIVHAYLEGEEGLFIEKEVSFADDTVSTKARLDFDAAVWDYRGWFKNAGA